MSSIPAYERDPYLRRLSVEVLVVGESDGRPYAVLDDTILYAEGGGQPADHGRLADIGVIDVQREDGEIRHYLESPASTGPAVLVLDWRRRYDHMQQHTAQHLLSALALTRFGWATRSFHLGAEVSDIELDAAELSETDLDALEDAAVTEIAAGRPIATRRVTAAEYAELDVRSRGLPAGHSGDIRLVEIDRIDRNTCGGTHLRSTAEIESLKILDTERLRGGHRVRWLAGGRVRGRLGAHEARSASLRGLFDTDESGLIEAAGRKLEQLAEARRRIRQLEADLAQARAKALGAGDELIITDHFENFDVDFLQQTARALLERAPSRACLLTASGETGSFFLIATGSENSLDAGELGPRVAELLEGRGGGSGAIFQGKAGSLHKRDDALSLMRRAVDRQG